MDIPLDLLTLSIRRVQEAWDERIQFVLTHFAFHLRQISQIKLQLRRTPQFICKQTLTSLLLVTIILQHTPTTEWPNHFHPGAPFYKNQMWIRTKAPQFLIIVIWLKNWTWPQLLSKFNFFTFPSFLIRHDFSQSNSIRY